MSISADQFIDQLSARGEVSFTTEKMRIEMGVTKKAVERAIQRLRKRKDIVSVARGYYLVLTPEFRQLGCLPPDYFISDLMQHWQQTYYVGLLSAALYHGAAHQQPQVFQVVTTHFRPAIQCGHVKIEFVIKKSLVETRVTQLKTHTGIMNISTPVATMMDLCLFIKKSGGLGRVSTIIDELAEVVTQVELKNLIKVSQGIYWMQRLGYILENLGHHGLSDVLYKHLKNITTRIIPLVPYNSTAGIKRDMKWRVAVNAIMESDLDDTD